MKPFSLLMFRVMMQITRVIFAIEMQKFVPRYDLAIAE